jgi:hypothetical protein
MEADKIKKDDLIITGNKVKRVITVEEDFDVAEMLVEKQKELAEWIESVRLYNESANEIEKKLKREIKKLKGL